MKLIRIKEYIRNFLFLIQLKYKLYFKSKAYNLVKEPDKCNLIIYRIKGATWEVNYLPEVFRICKSSKSMYYHPEQNILLLSKASVLDKSDLVITKDGVVWDKSYYDNFTKVIPLDGNLLTYNTHQVIVVKNNTKKIAQECISLLGVHANVWAHFIVQFLPKLYYAENAGLLNKNILILIPNYTDAHIKEILTHYMAKFPSAQLYIVNSNIEYICEKLYYIPTSSIISNHVHYLMTADEVFPSIVLDHLYKNMVEPLLKLSSNSLMKYEKVYLVRRNVYRGLKNYADVEAFFENQGFFCVEPHKLSLTDKVALFYNAKIIVGPCSSAFSNLIFSQHMTRVLVFSNLIRTIEPYLSDLASIAGIKLMYVTGRDYSSSIHTDYEIEVSRIEEAYNELLNE